jgi:hypothetical protein
MKRLLQLLGLCVVSLTSMRAEAFMNDANSCCNQPQWALQAELLYLKAETGDTGFVSQTQVSTVQFNDTRVLNDSDYKPGFRIEADWMMCDCNTLQLRYVHLNNTHRRTVSGTLSPLVILESTPPGDFFVGSTASSQISVNYNAGDIVWDRYLFNGCDFDLSFMMGLHVAAVKYKEAVDVFFGGVTVGPFATGVWETQFWGIGPEIGFKAHYMLPWICNLSLAGDFRGALLAGRTAPIFESRAVTLTKRHNDPNHWGAVPAIDARLGFNYAWNCWCFNSNIEVGYEMIWYSRVIDKVLATSTIVPTTAESFSNLSMHGPYAALRFSF